jgi:putative transposase
VILARRMYSHKSVEYICSLFGKSRQGFYNNKRHKEERQMEDTVVLSLVKEIRKEQPKLGTVKLKQMLSEELKAHRIKMGRDKLYQLLDQHGLLVRPRIYKPRTTNSNHPYKRYNNLVRNIELTQACQMWASDITFIRTSLGFLYLSLITDCYSRKIVGWCLWPDLTSRGVLNALDMALVNNPLTNGLIHHSDRGIQYCCNDYVRELERHKIAISMTENGDPYENAIAERVNGILKHDFNLNQTFDDYYSANESVKRAIELYNNKRPHRSCDMLTPNEAHKRRGELKKHWKSKKKTPSSSQNATP